jgi:hypothetical protein
MDSVVCLIASILAMFMEEVVAVGEDCGANLQHLKIQHHPMCLLCKE